MLKAFQAHIEKNELCKYGDQLLLAVSGGIDSVVMAHLFFEADYTSAIAHCNFQLRGEDSESDEVFVRSLAAKLEMPVYVKRFNVEEVVREKGISVQMAARELRYSWFEELLQQHSYDAVATAHNKNDSVETFLLNLSRGTGIRGLSGIPPRNRNIIRPLLFASRQDIIAYTNGNQLAFREDSSNRETKYRRNKIRHDVIPIMEQVNPGFVETMAQNMSRLSESHAIFIQSVDLTRKELFERGTDRIRIEIAKLKSLSPIRTWLYELFSPFGFTTSQCEGIEKIMDAEPGRQSISTTHQLYKDRDQLILVESIRKTFDRYYLDNPENLSSLPFPMDVEELDRSELNEIPDDQQIACLDHAKIQFPLTIRHWLHGDYFYPLGMNQMKKLSDFFVDEKISVPEKERTWILASGNKIIWIMGHRIDNRFKITEKTSRILLLRFQPNVGSQHLKEFL
ncbi:MAG: tRNA lysidine(34) synthetase TilS [Bacteroidales bacterium]|nr:tRNA lysidine(34) synthetase TilS [Bacteroidales bacterium]